MQKTFIITATVIALGLVIFFKFFGTSSKKNVPVVLISQTVNHPALDTTVRGIIDALATAGFKNNENIMIKTSSAQANPSLATQIASNFMGMEPSVVVGVGTMAAQAFLRYRQQTTIPLIFSSVTDPQGAGLSSPKALQQGITGVSNFVTLEPQIELFKKILPRMTKIGILYSPGEANATAIVRMLESLCPQQGLTLVPQTVMKTSDIAQNTALLASKVDAIFVSNDNTILSAIKAVINIAKEQKIPVFVSDIDAVSLGALAALGPNQYDVGQQTGRMIAAILQGKKASEIPVEYPAKTELYLNTGIAEKFGITLPKELITSATQIFPQGKTA